MIEKSINLAIKETEKKIAENVSGLPVSIARLILENILSKIKNTEIYEVAKEQQSFIAEVNKVNKENEGGV